MKLTRMFVELMLLGAARTERCGVKETRSFINQNQSLNTFAKNDLRVVIFTVGIRAVL